MKIRFFLLGTEKHSSSERFKAELKELFSDCLSDNGDVASFENMKEATTEIAKAVEEVHTLVFVADCEQFGAVKQMLSKAFGFEITCDSALLERACAQLDKDTAEEDYGFSVTHAFICPNSRVFVLDDGLYAGFSVANGNQTIILLPYEKERTSVLFTSQVVPYLNASYHTSIDNSSLKKYYAQRFYEALSSKNTSVAVAKTSTADFFKEYTAADERLEELIKYSPLAEKRGDMSPVDYVVNLSVVASEFMNCRYGVAISSAYYTGDSPESEKIVYLAVTNERETSVREIHSFKGEDIPSFLSRCCGDLCVFVEDILCGDELVEEDYSLREKAAVKRYKISIAAAAAAILALTVFIFSYFYSHNYSIVTWAENFIEWIFPAGNPFEGMFDSNVPGDDEAQATVQFISESTTVQSNETTAEAEDTTGEEASSAVDITKEVAE